MIKKSILQNMLAVLARAALRRHRPLIIGVTGSVGKTSARLAVYAMLKKKYRVRTAEKNYNNEIGLPLTILGISHHGRDVFAWSVALARAALRAYGLLMSIDYPEVLVLEYGVDKPGDMDQLLSVARPDIVVVTAIGETPVHVEFFKNKEELVAEKAKIVAAVPSDGTVVLNCDDTKAYGMRVKTAARIVTFGMSEQADVRAGNASVTIAPNGMPTGMALKVEYNGSVVPVWLTGALGMPQAYAAAAAAAVGTALDMHLVEISEALADYIPPAGRMRVLKGKNNSLILDDTYNAAPAAVAAALETLRSLPGKRKIAVLGGMLELGRLSDHVHLAIGEQAVGIADFIVTVGSRATGIGDAAADRGFDRKNILSFPDAARAGKAIAPMLQEGDIVLVKGSQSIRMERAVEHLIADPEAASALVRQESHWKKK